MTLTDRTAQLIDQALAELAEETPDFPVAPLRTILHKNAQRNRLDDLAKGSYEDFKEFVAQVAGRYAEYQPYLHALQIKKNDKVWKELGEKLRLWAYHFLVRKNFYRSEETRELAEMLGTEAAMQILNAYFPYDVTFDSWARVVVHNSCRRYIRDAMKKSKIPRSLLTDLESISELEPGEDDDPQQINENRLTLDDALSKLPDARRKVIVWTYFEELSTEEIARRLDRTIAAIYTLRFHALEELRKILDENGNNYE